MSRSRLLRTLLAVTLALAAGCYAGLEQVRRDGAPAWYYTVSRAGKILAAGAVEAGAGDEVLRVEPPAGMVWRASLRLQGFGVPKEVTLSFPPEGGVWRIYGLEIVIKPCQVLRQQAPQPQVLPQVPAAPAAALVREDALEEGPEIVQASAELPLQGAEPANRQEPVRELKASAPEQFESRERKLLAWVEERKRAEEEERRRLEEKRRAEQKLRELQQNRTQDADRSVRAQQPRQQKTPADVLEEMVRGQKASFELVRRFLVPVPVYVGTELAVFIEELYRSKEMPQLYLASLKVRNRTSKAVPFDARMLRFPGMVGAKGSCSNALAPGEQCTLYAAMMKQGAS